MVTFRDDKREKMIPQGVVSRLPVYFRYLSELAQTEDARVSSAQLGEALRITAAQIRSDLNFFGSFGQQGLGYRVDELLQAITEILGLDRNYHLVLVGAGNLGRAVASYQSFRLRGFTIKAIFDANPMLEGSYLSGRIIHSVERLPQYLKEHAVDIGIIATPHQASQEICDVLVAHHVKGIWNFSPTYLEAPESVVVEDMHLTDSLLRLSFRLQEQRDSKEE